jgi:2-polyprenyl-3-methyl-5-hydroxy-6-metoxy-1,4-benzoquinol methylase
MEKKQSSEYQVNWDDAKISFFSGLVEGRDVLDVGMVQHETEKVGIDTWLHRALCLKSGTILGLDIDSEGVEYLNKSGFNAVCEDAQNFSIGRTFEVITAGDLIEHLDNPGGFLECAKAHLAPGGKLILSTPNPFWWKTYLHVLIKGSSCPHPEHTCWYCERTLTQLLERHGYRVERLEYGTVYILSTLYQKLTKFINTVMPLPNRFRHNTIMLVAKVCDSSEA